MALREKIGTSADKLIGGLILALPFLGFGVYSRLVPLAAAAGAVYLLVQRALATSCGEGIVYLREQAEKRADGRFEVTEVFIFPAAGKLHSPCYQMNAQTGEVMLYR